MIFHFVDTNTDTSQVYKKYLENAIPNSEFHNDRILNMAPLCDTLVSAANSRLFFDSGSDLEYIHLFGRPDRYTRDKLQTFWKRRSEAFNPKRGAPPHLPVGAAMRVNVLEKNFIVVPTMTLPQPVPETQNAKHAFKILLELLEKNGGNYEHVLVPSFCTGVGRMDAETSAIQVLQAWRDHECGKRFDILPNEPDFAFNPHIMLKQPKYYMNSLFIETSPSEIISIPTF
jgi:O-acetyl-ADP-ribose deacetylase (regulator of RNase III)